MVIQILYVLLFYLYFSNVEVGAVENLFNPWLSIAIFLSLYIYLSIYVSILPFQWWKWAVQRAFSYPCRQIYLSIYVYIYLSTYLHIYSSIYLHIYLTTYLSIYLVVEVGGVENRFYPCLQMNVDENAAQSKIISNHYYDSL